MFCNISKDVLAYMSPSEVGRLVAELRAEANAMAEWNEQRDAWAPPSPGWEVGPPPPRSPDDYGKTKTR